ncbi:MAG TPA: ATP-binding protein [Longimicrobiaceae bacterium]|nr:ATP-binding protein [Longimicrobiaceae bacterium]
MSEPLERSGTAHSGEQVEHLLAGVANLLASSLDYQETLRGVAELAVRWLADLCIVDIVEGGEIKRLEAVHADPEQAELTRELLRFPLDRRRPHLSRRAIETRRSVLVPEVSAEALDSIAQGEEHWRILAALRPRSFMAVPLLARDRLLGVVLFVSSSRTYDERDLAFAERITRLAGLAVDNARLYREARQALLARDRVLGIVAHDLRDPLNAVAMSANLLLDESFTAAQHARQAQMILRSVGRMNRLIQDLLDVARIEAGKLSLHREIQAPGAIVEEAVELEAAVARSASLALHCSVSDAVPAVWADRDRILQVLSNLVGNAIKFTPPGGRIEVRAEEKEGGVRFSVSDTGPGIPPDDLPQLFQPFWQARRGSVEGAGLGLAIARGIVEAHGGTIWAESAPGVGSTFCFTLPASSPPGEEPKKGTASGGAWRAMLSSTVLA